MPPNLPPSLGLLACACLFAIPCEAAAPDPCSASSSVSDAQFTLALQSDHAVFQQGEIIPLSLAFTSAAKGRYSADDRNYDRSGRLNIERYCLEPSVPDPLQSYFSVGAFMGGGLGSTHSLDATPFTAQADLNEYLSPAPGHYRLYAISYRVWRPPDPHEETPYGRVSEIVRSNTIEFEVKSPSPQWQHEQLQAALAILSSTPNPKPGLSNSDDPVRKAARRLRFLNSRESTEQLARLFSGRAQDQPYAWEFALGLFGSPFRQVAIDSLRQQIAVPDHAITGDFLQTLVHLQITADPAWDTPESFSSDHPPDDKTINAYWESRRAHEEELTRAEVQDVLAALPHKVGSARALTALGLLNSGAGGLAPPMAGELRQSLIASWKDLPSGTRDQLIQYQWPLVAGPEMLPVLQEMVAQSPPSGRTMGAMTRDAALKHIFELDPTVARPLILRDLQNRNAEPSLDLLRLLTPEEVAPALQPAIQHIAKGEARDLDFKLIDRYADTGSLGQLQAAFEPNLGKWACAPQSAMLRYFLRVAPEYGAAQVAASLQARKDTHCYSQLLQDLGDQLPHAERSAIEALDDPDPEVVQDAVIALGRWGTSAAEPALWTRLERFHQEWAAREDELRSSPDYRTPRARATALEQALVIALANGSGWLCPPEKLSRLNQLALTAQSREAIKMNLEMWKQPIHINPQWSSDQDTTFVLFTSSTLTEDQLRDKLAQFPRGTRLDWQFWPPCHISPPVSMAKQEAAYESMRSVAQEHSITIEKVDDP
jgi:hypothetical protein